MLKLKACLVLMVLSIAFPCLLFADETLTITTYYPSPYGSYREINAYRMKIGTNYSGSGTSVSDDNLIVEGAVGIGKVSPGQKLDVAGNVKGTGLCINDDCWTSWSKGVNAMNVLGGTLLSYTNGFNGSTIIGPYTSCSYIGHYGIAPACGGVRIQPYEAVGDKFKYQIIGSINPSCEGRTYDYFYCIN